MLGALREENFCPASRKTQRVAVHTGKFFGDVRAEIMPCPAGLQGKAKGGVNFAGRTASAPGARFLAFGFSLQTVLPNIHES